MVGKVIMKKWVSIVLVICMLAAVCGCGKENDKKKAIAQSKDYVYTFESLSANLGDRVSNQTIVAEDRLLFISYRYEDPQSMVPEAKTAEIEIAVEEGNGGEEAEPAEEEITEEIIEEEIAAEAVEATEGINHENALEEGIVIDSALYEEYGEYQEPQEPRMFVAFIQCDMEGNILSEFEIEHSSNSGINGTVLDENGNIYTVVCEYGMDMSDPEMVRDLYTLVGYSQNGEELFRTQLGLDQTDEEYFYVNQLYYDNGQLILWDTRGIEIYQTDSSFVKTIELNTEETGSIYLMKDGTIGVLCYGNENQYLKTLNPETGELSEKVEFPFNSYSYSLYSGKTSDFMLVDSLGVYTYNMGEEAPVKIMDFIDSDMATGECYSLVEVSETEFCGSTYDNESGEYLFGMFTKVDPSTIPDKKVVTLGTMWLDYDIRGRIVEFNKSNNEYRIRVEEYEKYNTTEDYTIGTTKLNTDIASGNAPDILCINSDMPVESYMSKGLFADIRTFVENDPEMNMEEFMPEVVEAFSHEGKWYQLVPSYYLFTVFGKAADVGREPGWTFDDLKALRAKKSPDVAVFSEVTNSTVLGYCMMLNSDQYVNWETGECYFNTQQFMDLLEFANEFPTEIDYEDLYSDDKYWESQETMYRENRTLLSLYTLANFEDFIYMEKGAFGEEITAIGFPVKDGVGSSYSANINFAISAKSEYQDVAWQFLRYYLTDEYQETIQYGWPLKTSCLDKLVEKALQKPAYEDEFGNMVEYDHTYYLNGVELVLDPLTKEDCDRVIGFLKSADHVYGYNSSIMMILTEECAAYFEGQKSVKEVADIIQSRVSLYVNENL